MSVGRHDIWGRHISEYFLKDPANAFFPKDTPAPTSRHAKTVAIPHLQHMAFAGPSSETCSMLTSVLYLVRYPKELRSLDNTLLLSRCMAILRTFTDDLEPGGNKLFTYELGFLCFRVIVLLIQVGILTHTNTFGAFVRQTSNLSDPQAISTALAAFVARLAVQFSSSDNPRDKLFGILTSQSGGRMFLRTVGGFYNTDISFFLNVIWNDRKNFSVICSQSLTSGWSFALLVLGEHMQWAVEVDSENDEKWRLLHTLCFRYILSTLNPDETFFLTGICRDASLYRYDDDDNEYYIISFVDMTDARNVMGAYVNRMKLISTGERLSSEILGLLLGFITQDVMLDVRQLLPGFLAVTCSWIWEELCLGSPEHLSRNSDLINCAAQTLDFAGKCYTISSNAGSKTIASYTKALSEQDFINLVGRLILAPLAVGSAVNNFSIGRDNDDLEVPDMWINLVQGPVVNFGREYVQTGKGSSGLLAGSYLDWLKTWRGFRAGFPHYNTKEGWYQTYTKECVNAWLTLGDAFGYGDRLSREQY
ncbi:hypothetical protein FRC12_001472, partial [Ceratobasidium sp. 428]